MLIDYDGVLGQSKDFIWSKENELWRTFYRTKVAGNWSKEDVDEFMKCGYCYEVHFDHSREHDAQTFALEVMSRVKQFKAAKVSRLAVNNVKVIVFLGRDKKMADRMKVITGYAGFELTRIRLASEEASEGENSIRAKFNQYLESVKNMFAPTLGLRAPRRRL